MMQFVTEFYCLKLLTTALINKVSFSGTKIRTSQQRKGNLPHTLKRFNLILIDIRFTFLIFAGLLLIDFKEMSNFTHIKHLSIIFLFYKTYQIEKKIK